MEIFGLTGLMSPCRDCKDRWINETGRCHSTCERYIEFKDKAKEINTQIKNERQRALRNPVKEIKTSSQLDRIEKARRR